MQNFPRTLSKLWFSSRMTTTWVIGFGAAAAAVAVAAPADVDAVPVVAATSAITAAMHAVATA